MKHLFGGWFFGRNDDSSVRIELRNKADVESPLIAALDIPADDWALVVAYVSHLGETAENTKQALDFHRG